ncbi:hemolysin XhlA [Cohnella zeiphila]|uniref:Hemolysin XhlA n=1 Tax=Cohnella zeiphila TaxID=2761120 RepID=A0A7X0SNJ6_9BACL|nr:hemolysin XhlA [Cohnella zeiphila]MBB6733174.1 hemolysin XhlA [Cohnella zeiphila]
MPENETNEILQRLTRVETKLDLMNNAREIAQEGVMLAKEAHHRIKELREELNAYKQTVK